MSDRYARDGEGGGGVLLDVESAVLMVSGNNLMEVIEEAGEVAGRELWLVGTSQQLVSYKTAGLGSEAHKRGVCCVELSRATRLEAAVLPLAILSAQRSRGGFVASSRLPSMTASLTCFCFSPLLRSADDTDVLSRFRKLLSSLW